MEKTITIYGAGYVGLVTGVCLAELGYQVLLIDTQAAKISELSQGICPIYETGLPELLKRHIKKGLLSFSTDLMQGITHGFFQFIAVGTPSAVDGSADLKYVFDVVKGISQHISEYRVIVTKSTVPVGTTQKIKQLMQKNLHDRDCHVEFDVVSNPEFLKQGVAIDDFMHPDRILVGVDNQRAAEYMRELYKPLNESGQSLIVMDVPSAEFTKYAANAYLASKISFMNEMSQLSEKLGVNIDKVRQAMSLDQRIGPYFLYAGCGFGGSCFPKDVRALKQMAEQVGHDVPLISAIETVNHRQKEILYHKISRYFSGDLSRKVVAVWGLAFKPNTDDMREASSCVLIEALLKAGAHVRAYDPVAREKAQAMYHHQSNFQISHSANDALQGSDILVIVTEWDEFRSPDFALIKSKLHYSAVFDGRNLYQPEVLAQQGLKYYAIGHGEVI